MKPLDFVTIIFLIGGAVFFWTSIIYWINYPKQKEGMRLVFLQNANYFMRLCIITNVLAFFFLCLGAKLIF